MSILLRTRNYFNTYINSHPWIGELDHHLQIPSHAMDESLPEENAISESSSLPFSVINQGDFHSVFGISMARLRRFKRNATRLDTNKISTMLHNWIASSILKPTRKQRTGKKRIITLEIFRSLPYDLILVVFAHLHPIDLYHLSQTNKALRAILMTGHGFSLWKTAFRNHPSLPSCPPDLSEPRWAAMLFGPDICDECGRHGALTDFVYRQRFCTACMKQHCVSRSQCGSKWRSVDSLVWELVPSSNRSGGNRYSFHHTCNARRLRRDLVSMDNTIRQFRTDIERGRPDAEQDFQDFQELTRARNSQLRNQHYLCQAWATDLYREMNEELFGRHKSVVDKIKLRLISRGNLACNISTRSIESIVYQELSPNPRLTRRVWRQILPRLEAESNAQKRQKILNARAYVISDVYNEYKRMVSPRSWPALPNVYQSILFEPFLSLYNDISDAPLDRAACADSIIQLPAAIERWSDELGHKLASLVPIQPIELGDRPPILSNLELATSVFVCRGCFTWRARKDQSEFCWIGWDNIKNHLSCTELSQSNGLIASRIGHDAASVIIQLLDLDPRIVTAKELDGHNARFLCASCPIEGFRRVWGRKVFTWRECVAHAVENEREDHSANSWQLLTPQACRFVRMREQHPQTGRDRSWSCTHCAAHFGNYVTCAMAIAHVREMHSIDEPTVNEDIFHSSGPGVQCTPRVPVVLQQKPLAEFACNKCAILGTRLFPLQNLVSHLRDRHGIRDPHINEDYVKIKVIARASMV